MSTDVTDGGPSTNPHHVVVVEEPLKVFTPPDYGNPGNKVYYDECNDELIVVQGCNIQFSPVFISKSRGQLNRDNADNYATEVGKVSVRGAKRSAGRSWLAVLTSDREISFYKWGLARSKPVTVYSCKQAFHIGNAIPGSFRRTNVVKDFYWLSDSVILILTSTAIETFVVSQSKSLQKAHHFGTTVDYYTYHARHKTLLCINKEKPAVIKTYRVGASSGITRHTRLKIDDASAKEHPTHRMIPCYSLAGERLPLLQYTLARLYGHTCLLHVLPARQEIVVYTLMTGGTWSKTAVLQLYEPSTYAINIVDNLIVVHNLSSNVSHVYDYRISGKPIAPPMQLGFSSPPALETPVSTTHGTSALYNPIETRYLQPDKLLDTNGRLYALYINLPAIVPSYSPKATLLTFLLQRRNSKKAVLQHIATAVRGQMPLQELGVMFDLVNASMARSLREREANGEIRRRADTRPPSAGGSVVGSSSTGSGAPPQGGRPGGRAFTSAPQQHGGAESAAADASPAQHNSAPGVAPPPRDAAARQPPHASGDASESDEDGSNPSRRPSILHHDNSAGDPGSPVPTAASTDTAGSPTGQFATLQGNTTPPLQPRRSFRSAVPLTTETGAVKCFMPVAPGQPLAYPFYTTADPNHYTTEGVLVVEQVDLWRDVFIRIYEERPMPMPLALFSAIFLEYYRSLSVYKIPPTNVLERLMIDLLIYNDPPNYPKLHHYLQYHVVEDTVPIALQLLKFEDRYPPSVQLALDMLARKNCYQQIVEVLITRGLFVRAVELMVQYQVEGVDVQYVLEKASTCKDPLTLYSLNFLLKKYNLVVRKVDGFSEKDRCPAFEENYAAVLGVPV